MIADSSDNGNAQQWGASQPVLLAAGNKYDVAFFKRAYEASRLSNPLQVVSNATGLSNYLRGCSGFADREQYPYPVLLVLDFRLPGCDPNAFSALLEPDEESHALPLIVFSGIADLKTMRTAYRLHATSFLIKPITGRELVETIQSIKKLEFQTYDGGWVIMPTAELRHP